MRPETQRSQAPTVRFFFFFSFSIVLTYLLFTGYDYAHIQQPNPHHHLDASQPAPPVGLPRHYQVTRKTRLQPLIAKETADRTTNTTNDEWGPRHVSGFWYFFFFIYCTNMYFQLNKQRRRPTGPTNTTVTPNNDEWGPRHVSCP